MSDQRTGTGEQVGGPYPAADHPAGQHVETGWHPGDDETAFALLQADHRGIIEAQGPVYEGDEVLAVCGVIEPQPTFSLRFAHLCPMLFAQALIACSALGIPDDAAPIAPGVAPRC